MIPSEPLGELSSQQAAMLALEAWLTTPAGAYFIAREQAWLDQVVTNLFGFRAVQLGTRQIDGLRESRIPHKAYGHLVQIDQYRLPASPFETGASKKLQTSTEKQVQLSPDLLMHFEAMPFESDSLDLLVLPHVLEFAQDPHQVLREAERVLMPEGRLIVTGFNPVSLWGVRHKIFKRWWPVWPKGCDPISIIRMKDWFKLLSLEPENGRFGGYRFPAFTEKNLTRYQFMEHAGDRWWPVCGGAYYLCAVKRVRGMRLIGPAFKKKRAGMKQLKPAAQKVVSKTSTIGEEFHKRD